MVAGREEGSRSGPEPSGAFLPKPMDEGGPSGSGNRPSSSSGMRETWQESVPAPGKGPDAEGRVVEDAVSETAPQPNGDELQELHNLERQELEPFFQPYWSAKFFGTALAACLIIWSFCWMYVGAFWNPTTRLPNLHVAVLNCDQVPPASSLNASFAPLLPYLAPGPIASVLLNASVYNRSSSLGSILAWDPANCRGSGGQAVGCGAREAECLAALSEDVLQGGPWAVLYFPSNFTASYLSWYAGSGAAPLQQPQPPTATYVLARGRDYSTYTYISSIIVTSLLPGISRSFTQGLATNPQAMQLLQPAFLATGVSLRQVDMAPVKNFGQHFATYIFCVLMWLSSSFVVVSSYQFKLRTELALADPRFAPPDRAVRLSHVAWALLVKGAVAALFMFVEMVLLCAVLWGLGGGNEQWHWNAGYAIAFGWYMSWSFISVNAVLLHVLGMERFSSMTALLLILQLTSASGIMSAELSNRFFYIGKGLPFFYGVRGFRTIFFGTLTDKMYQNWLLLTAYNAVFLPLGLLLVARRVWSNARGAAGNRVKPGQGRPAGAAAVSLTAMPVGFA